MTNTEYNTKYMRSYRQRYPEKCKKATLKHYYNNREKLLVQSRARRDRHQAIIDNIKTRPCADCKQEYPSFVMDFDHVRGRKKFQIGGSLHLSLSRLLAEVAKCDVVCSNCHRYRTFGRRGKKIAGRETKES